MSWVTNSRLNMTKTKLTEIGAGKDLKQFVFPILTEHFGLQCPSNFGGLIY